MLPALAVYDLQSDSENARKLIEQRNAWETGPTANSITVNVEEYLRNGEKNSLFKKLSPNVNTRGWRGSKPLYIKSSFLGFSNAADTMKVNHMLNDSGLLLYGSHIAWGNCQDSQQRNTLGLAVIPPGAKQLQLTEADVEQVKTELENLHPLWNWFERLTGESLYSVTIHLTPGAVEKVQSAFPDDTALLIKCRFGSREIFCSTVSQQVVEGFTLLRDANLR